MKKVLLIIIVLSFKSYSQNIEKTITGVQVGLFGAEVYNESRISEKIALRSQIALDRFLVKGGSMYSKTMFAIFPSISLQPKYYYNINKRKADGKNIKNNSANYISAQVVYVPNFAISNYGNLKESSQLEFIPTFGLRRNFAQKFNYEFKIGFGYAYLLEENVGAYTFDLGFKVGYDF